jgi:hypothetical protein
MGLEPVTYKQNQKSPTIPTRAKNPPITPPTIGATVVKRLPPCWPAGTNVGTYTTVGETLEVIVSSCTVTLPSGIVYEVEETYTSGGGVDWDMIYDIEAVVPPFPHGA